MIIGLNPHNSIFYFNSYFDACDVSWISEYVSEKEILVKRNSCVYAYTNKIVNSGEKQYLICDKNSKFDDLFS